MPAPDSPATQVMRAPATAAAPPAEAEFDRASAERILARAVALSDAGEVESGFDEATVRAVASELGIPTGAVQRAIDEERAGVLRPPAKAGLAAMVAGPAIAVAERVLPHADAIDRADLWLTRAAGMRRQRLSAREGLWERRDDVAAKLARAVRGLGGDKEITEIRSLHVHAIATDDGILLRCTADLADHRVQWLTAGGATTAVGVAAIGVVATATAPLLLVALPAAPALGALVAAQHRRRVRATEKALERLLDRMVNDPVPVSPIRDRVGRVLGQAVDAGTKAVEDRRTRKRNRAHT